MLFPSLLPAAVGAGVLLHRIQYIILCIIISIVAERIPRKHSSRLTAAMAPLKSFAKKKTFLVVKYPI